MQDNITTRAAHFSDVDHIFMHVSKVTEAEVMASGVGHQGLYDYVIRQMEAFPAIAAVYQGEPIAILGVERGGDNDLFTWFISAETYFELGHKSARFGRKFMKTLMKVHSGKRVLSVSSSPHPDAARWFRLMGGKQISEYEGTKVFEF